VTLSRDCVLNTYGVMRWREAGFLMVVNTVNTICLKVFWWDEGGMRGWMGCLALGCGFAGAWDCRCIVVGSYDGK
jgi:hypothetical protein